MDCIPDSGVNYDPNHLSTLCWGYVGGIVGQLVTALFKIRKNS